MPISGWIMFGYFWAIIFAGVTLAIVGWRRGLAEPENRTYYALPERRPEPWPGPQDAERPEREERPLL
jgi:hypothetical protein